MAKQTYGKYKGRKLGSKLKRSAINKGIRDTVGLGLRFGGDYTGYYNGRSAQMFNKKAYNWAFPKQYVARLGSNFRKNMVTGFRSPVTGSRPGPRLGSNTGPPAVKKPWSSFKRTKNWGRTAVSHKYRG